MFTSFDQIAEYVVSNLDYATVIVLNDEYTWFAMDWQQFDAVQASCSEAKFSEYVEETMEWFIQRDKELLEQDASNSPYHYCQFGVYDGALAYKTTSGTLLLQWINPEAEGETIPIRWSPTKSVNWPKHSVGVPACRVGGFHYQNIQYALAGMTREMHTKWHNAHLFLETAPEVYDEYAKFHNQLTQFKPMPTAEELLQQRASK